MAELNKKLYFALKLLFILSRTIALKVITMKPSFQMSKNKISLLKSVIKSSLALVCLHVLTAQAQTPLVFENILENPLPGSTVQATGSDVTVVYSNDDAARPTGSWQYFLYSPYNPQNNTFGSDWFYNIGGEASWRFNHPVVGDLQSLQTTWVMSDELQHTSLTFTLEGGAVWSASQPPVQTQGGCLDWGPPP